MRLHSEDFRKKKSLQGVRSGAKSHSTLESVPPSAVEGRVEAGQVQLVDERARDWSAQFPTVTRALQKLKAQSAVLNGRIVCLDEEGRPSLQNLQRALQTQEHSSVIYFISDLFFLNGQNLRSLPKGRRRKMLEKLLSPLQGSAVLFQEDSKEF